MDVVRNFTDMFDITIPLQIAQNNIAKTREQIVNDIFLKNPPNMIKPYNVELFCTYLPDNFTVMSPE